MDILSTIQQYGTHEKCISFLENVRWHNLMFCPLCGNADEKTIACYPDKTSRFGKRHYCGECRRSFSVTVGTLFHNTKLPLQKWILAIILELNAKKSLSSCQLARDIGITQKSAWRMLHKIREAMKTDQAMLLRGIVEMDETYIGGKPRKGNKRKDGEPRKRGRGTDKAPVVGAVERNGGISVKSAENQRLTAAYFRQFIEECVDIDESVLITDEYPAYGKMHRLLPHLVINHGKSYAEGYVHTNTIESFWGLLKRGYYGQYHHYSKKYLSNYLGQFAYKWNNRKAEVDRVFMDLTRLMLCAA